MSYFLQCDCGKKLTKKPMKTLICPKCHSVYKKSKKFLYSLYFCLIMIGILVTVLFGDKIFNSADYYWLILFGIIWFWRDIDILDLVILAIGFFIFFYFGGKNDNFILFGFIAIVFCWASATFFVYFFKYEKEK